MMRNIVLVLGASSNRTFIDQTMVQTTSILPPNFKVENQNEIILDHLTLMLHFCLAKIKKSEPSSNDKQSGNSYNNQKNEIDLYPQILLDALPEIRILSHIRPQELEVLLDQIEWTIAEIKKKM